MNNEEKLIVTALSDYVEGRSTSKPDYDFSYEKLLETAKIQDICGIIWVQLRSFIPKGDVREKLRNCFHNEIYLYVKRKYYFGEFEKQLNSEGINYIPLNGLVYSLFYPDSELRSMNDVDVLVDDLRIDDVRRILVSLGYSIYDSAGSGFTCNKEEVIIEVHTRAFSADIGNGADLPAFFESVWERSKAVDRRFLPDLNYNFVLIAANLARHISEFKSGIRPFLDMILMSGYITDVPYVEKKLEELNLLEFIKVASSIVYRLFNVKLPFQQTGISEVFFEESVAVIFSDGLHGNEIVELLTSDDPPSEEALKNAEAKIQFAREKHRFAFPFFGKRKKNDKTSILKTRGNKTRYLSCWGL